MSTPFLNLSELANQLHFKTTQFTSAIKPSTNSKPPAKPTKIRWKGLMRPMSASNSLRRRMPKNDHATALTLCHKDDEVEGLTRPP